MSFTYHESSGHTEPINAESMEEAIKKAEELCREGDWGIEGASIDIKVTEEDEDGDIVDTECITVQIEPDHEELIRLAGGDTNCKHDWTSEGEGGCDENPGVWSLGGTTILCKSHCTKCNLKRTEVRRGSQRNPGEYDTVEYNHE